MDNKKNKIPLHEADFKEFSRDEIGRVFRWNNRVFRAINEEKVSHVNELLKSGLIEELTKKNMFPKTWITNYQIGDFPLVLEHKKIERIIYPFEWSFEMLKDAALLVLEINKIAKQYGYQTKDSHGYNILFDRMTPKFVDFGSFIKKEKEYIWKSEKGFLRFYYYPLKIWADGNSIISRSVLANITPLDTSNYLLYKIPFFRLIDINSIRKVIAMFWQYKKLNNTPNKKIKEKLPSPLNYLLIYLKYSKLLPFQKTNLNKLIKKVRKINTNNSISQWGSYHNDEKTFTRFNDLINIINSVDNIYSATELAGNQGLFSEKLLGETSIREVICTDYDENAIDAMYKKRKGKNLSSLLLNFMDPSIRQPLIEPSKRLKSDIVIALAITHHLLFTQRYPIDYILRNIKKYSNKYVLIEFMPLGLYSRKSKTNPPVPTWYNENWFENHFKNHFNIINKKQIGKNRIIFFGQIK